MGPWSGTLTVGRHRLGVDVRGADPRLLLINGLGSGASVWEPLRAALPPGLGTVSFDAPGCGDSPPVEGPVSVPHLAELAAAVSEQVVGSQLDVLGFSFGGMVAQQLAHDRPDLVRRLVLVSTGVGIGSWPGSALALGLLTWPGLVSSAALAETLGPLVFGGDADARSGRARRTAFAGSAVHGPSYAGQLVAAATWSSLPWVGLLPQRTLLLAGDRDPLVPACNAAVLATLVRRGRLHVVRGGGHLLVVDRAPEVADVVSEFLAAP